MYLGREEKRGKKILVSNRHFSVKLGKHPPEWEHTYGACSPIHSSPAYKGGESSPQELKLLRTGRGM